MKTYIMNLFYCPVSLGGQPKVLRSSVNNNQDGIGAIPPNKFIDCHVVLV